VVGYPRLFAESRWGFRWPIPAAGQSCKVGTIDRVGYYLVKYEEARWLNSLAD